CSARGVEIEVAFTRKIGAGLFGGEGFILQRLQGDGMAFVHAGGTIIQKDLAAGQTLRVDTGCLVAFSPSVSYDIRFIGGFKNALFGGEGIFLAEMTGPGRVFLQSLPFSRLADRIPAGCFSRVFPFHVWRTASSPPRATGNRVKREVWQAWEGGSLGDSWEVTGTSVPWREPSLQVGEKRALPPGGPCVE
ncbi:MAG: AIM24 family protein, partial [Deltaproteobacteria bacterium]|nr:AIM24 family protein [Deltaproteobacteria bacterium]